MEGAMKLQSLLTNLLAAMLVILLVNGALFGQGGWTDDGSVVRLTTSTDKVGIGTATPVQALDVRGSINAQGTSGSNFIGRRDGIPVNDAFLARFRGEGRYDASNFSAVAGEMAIRGDGTFTATSWPTKIQFWTTPMGSTTELERMVIRRTGNVGIGTSNPTGKLEVENAASSAQATLFVDQNYAGFSAQIIETVEYGLRITGDATSASRFLLNLQGNGGSTEAMYVGSDGNVGIGTTTPDVKLDVEAANSTAVQALSGASDKYTAYSLGRTVGDSEWGVASAGGDFSNFATAGDIILRSGNGAEDLILTARNASGNIRFGTGNPDTEKMTILSNGNVGIGTTNPARELHVVGTTRTDVIEITGGSDLAGPFKVVDADIVEPGMVVCIDPDRPGQLRVASKAYDRTVAGIISGAGGVRPGILMTQTGSEADGEFPVALTGRVYAWADASKGPIKPGDLLTTSDTPGHIMNVTDHRQAMGAIIGKAMSALDEGQGLVLVLVALQ